MENGYTIDVGRNLIEFRLSGKAERDEIFSAIMNFVEDPRYHRSMDGVADLRGLQPKVTQHDIELICSMIKSIGSMSYGNWIAIADNPRVVMGVQEYQNAAGHQLMPVSPEEGAAWLMNRKATRSVLRRG